MKREITIALALFVGSNVSAQLYYDTLDLNNASAQMNEAGWLFSRPNPGATLINADMSPGYEWPKGSGKYLMNGLGLWLEGNDVNGMHSITHVTGQDFVEQFPGVLTIQAPDPYGPAYPVGFWDDLSGKVTREQIEYHIANYNDPTYQIPDAILNWPAHGDVSLGMYYWMAPFFDVDGNQLYTPENGDYPCILGDEMMYMVLNGKAHHSGFWNVRGIPIEIRYSLYQYNSVPGLEDVTFCKIEAINRSTTTFFDFNAGLYLDGLIGAPDDDFAGTDTLRNMLYTYNGDNLDASSQNFLGYGMAPPAVGIKILNQDLTRSKTFQMALGANHVFPDSTEQFIQLMNGLNYDDTPTVEHFNFEGDPVTGSGNVATQPEAKTLGIMDFDLIQPGVAFTIDFAVVVGQGTTNLNSIEVLRQNADFVQFFYDNQVDDCAYATLNTTELESNPEIHVYPNPSSGSFQVSLNGFSGKVMVSVVDVHGRPINEEMEIQSGNHELHLDVHPGTYFLKVSDGSITSVQRLIVQ